MSTMEPQPFGAYTLVHQLGRGGMAEVYLARGQSATGFSRLVAIKRLLGSFNEDQQIVSMLADEARLSVWLYHPNIVQILDFGCVESIHYIAMEYVDGCDLSTLIRDRRRRRGRPLPLATAIFSVLQIAEALAYAHRRTGKDGQPLNLIHRDVSPHNVLVSRDGHVKLADFGLARASVSVHQSSAGVIRGKFPYMPKEQAHGREIDQRIDIFAAGVTLYEALTGIRPYTSSNLAQQLYQLEQEIPPPSTHMPDIPPEIDDLTLQAISPSPDDRYQTAADMADDLRHALSALSTQNQEAQQLAALVRRFAPTIPPALLAEHGAVNYGELIVPEHSLIEADVLQARNTGISQWGRGGPAARGAPIPDATLRDRADRPGSGEAGAVGRAAPLGAELDRGGPPKVADADDEFKTLFFQRGASRAEAQMGPSQREAGAKAMGDSLFVTGAIESRAPQRSGPQETQHKDPAIQDTVPSAQRDATTRPQRRSGLGARGASAQGAPPRPAVALVETNDDATTLIRSPEQAQAARAAAELYRQEARARADATTGSSERVRAESRNEAARVPPLPSSTRQGRRLTALVLMALALLGFGLLGGWILRGIASPTPTGPPNTPGPKKDQSASPKPASLAPRSAGAAESAEATTVDRADVPAPGAAAGSRGGTVNNQARRARPSGHLASEPRREPHELARGSGVLVVTCARPAQVLINEQVVGPTPLRGRIPTGVHRIKVVSTSGGQPSVVRTVHIREGQLTTLNF